MLDLAKAAYLVIVAALGVVLIVSPITVARFMMLWPRFIFPIIVNESRIPPKTRTALDLIRRDRQAYARRFWYQLLIFRISGVIVLLIVLIVLVLTIVTVGTGR